MNTAQRYAGNGNSASPIEPTAHPQPAGTASGRIDHHQKLFELLDQFVREDSLAGNVETLLDAAYDQLSYQVGAHLEREMTPPRTYTLHVSELANLYSGLRLAYHLVAIREQWNLIQQERKEGHRG